MAKFTAGERRGLIVLMIVLALLGVVMFLSSRGGSPQARIDQDSVSVRFDSVSSTGNDLLRDSIVRPVKKKKKPVKNVPPPSRRNPLDEGLN